ncbi:MAG: DUF3006 domain-containing protein [Acutalibacteraceae bacterium]
MFLSIDRFDGDYAICQDDNEKLYEIKMSELPENAKPGDVLKLSPDSTLSFDVAETLNRKKRIKKLQDKLFGID